MSTRSNRVPSYRLHRPSGQAVVTLHGHDCYLGKHGTPDSQAQYDRLVAQYVAERRQHAEGRAARPGLTITEMILATWPEAERHYCYPDGTPTGELENLRDALRPLRAMYGQTPAAEFGPLALRAVRETMMQAGLARTTINARINRIRRAFRWAASLELIPVAVPQALATVPGLQRGRCGARESAGVKPVNWKHVEGTLPYLPRPVAAIVLVLRYTGCRAADAVLMRGCDLRMDGDIWTYEPGRHKNGWRGHARIIHLGPQAQEIIRPFFRADPQVFLFSPRDAWEEHHARRRQQRQTKRTPSELRRRRKSNPKWSPGLRYTVNNLQQAVRRACRRAAIPEWSILQIRHARATDVRERYGIEGTAAALGHRRVETSQIYAEKNDKLSRDIAREIG
jgi:integrase